MFEANHRFFNVSLAIALTLLFACSDNTAGERSRAATAGIDYQEIEDSGITSKIDAELLIARGVDSDEINITTVEGVVTLSGTVDNILAKERAERIASMIKGVRSVVNNIDVVPPFRTDTEIEANVEHALLNDPATDSWELDIDVNDGKVTLTGTVESWGEKNLAETVAKNVSGVTGVKNDISVDHSEQPTDLDIKHAIEQRLKWDVRLNDGLIDVSVTDGVVELSGAVGSAYERSLASTKAWLSGAKNVNTVALEVKWWARDDMVRKESEANLTDAEIEDAIEDAFLYDPRVNTFNVDAEVTNGIASLTGTVDNVKAKRAAAQDADNTMGVLQVENNIRINLSPDEAPSDVTVTAGVSTSLLYNPYVERHEIKVTTDKGVVTLEGDVDSYFEKWHAEDVAARVPGVSAIVNNLDVGYKAPDVSLHDWDPLLDDHDVLAREEMTDQELKRSIQDELDWSPFVDEKHVSVVVDDGVATLSGTVDTRYEKLEAAEEAFEGGALLVNNELTVKGYDEQKKLGRK